MGIYNCRVSRCNFCVVKLLDTWSRVKRGVIFLCRFKAGQITKRMKLCRKRGRLPRDENEPADALTNSDFSGFDPLKRRSVVWSDVDWSLLQSLWEERSEFLNRDSWKSCLSEFPSTKFEKSSWS